MAVLVADFKTLFPEFGTVDNARLQLFIDQAEAQVNRDCWGSKADAGVQYLAAHLVATMDQDGTASGHGPITQKKVGEVSASFGFSQNMLDSSLSSTKYGRNYNHLLRLVFCCRCT